MNHLSDIQTWLRDGSLDGLVVPSTDKYLSEWTPPGDRRLRWVTGFRGSTGIAVILQDSAVLFLDGRYREQGIADTKGATIVVEAAALSARERWLKQYLRDGARLGIDPWLHSIPELAEWRNTAAELRLTLKFLDRNPIDQLWLTDRPPQYRPRIVDYDCRYAGEPYEDKCRSLIQYVCQAGLKGLLVADPEDVSWLLNVRAEMGFAKSEVGDLPPVPSCTSRALIRDDGSITWYVEESRVGPDVLARESDIVTIVPPERLESHVTELARQGPIGADLRRTPAALGIMIEGKGVTKADDAVARRRWRKHAAEIESARRAHIVDAAAVVRFAVWLKRMVLVRPITEFEAAEALEGIRSENPNYKGPSMPVASASGPSGALPHYVPQRPSSRRLSDHPIYWMDSGGHYPGGTTDNTITLALGTPEPKHILAHTLVLKGFIALALARFPERVPALRLDTITRLALWHEGMDFDHNTGHGVGNNLNVHEGVLIGRVPGPRTLVGLEAGMIVTNEPGYYLPGDFGLRIESHMLVVESAFPNFLEFATISRLPIDHRLVDFTRLTGAERRWLAEYHRVVARDLHLLLDEPCREWLTETVDTFSKFDQHADLMPEASTSTRF